MGRALCKNKKESKAGAQEKTTRYRGPAGCTGGSRSLEIGTGTIRPDCTRRLSHSLKQGFAREAAITQGSLLPG